MIQRLQGWTVLAWLDDNQTEVNEESGLPAPARSACPELHASKEMQDPANRIFNVEILMCYNIILDARVFPVDKAHL